MQNLWSDRDAEAAAQHYGAEGVSRELALRVYTTRLLGGEPQLVLHGGGNTSLKTRAKDLLGEEVEVLCVKGSGWDMATIEPPGLPAVRLEPLRKLRRLASLSDEDMVNAQRGNLLDSAAPNPSVETLLHAFLPHTYIDHTHANAVLALSDQPRGEEICREVFGERVAIVPYIMPGFALAKTAAEVFEADPEVEGLILAKHGIFTFGGTAREVLRAHDRAREPGRAAPRARCQPGHEYGSTPADARLRGGDRTHPARTRSPRDRARGGPLHPLRHELPQWEARARLRERRRARALRPSGCCDPRSRDPHQARPAHPSGPGRRELGCLRPRGARRLCRL